MADGGHLENKKNRVIFKTVWSIMMKFCMMTQISTSELTSCSKIKYFKIQDGR